MDQLLYMEPVIITDHGGVITTIQDHLPGVSI
jgi:hypothetical protein